MRVVRASLRTLTFPLDGRGAARGRTERTSIVLEVVTDTGVVGLGEAAPLPGTSRDTVDDARLALTEFVNSVHAGAANAPTLTEPSEIFAIAATFATNVPSARFAIETALLDALARTSSVTIAGLLRAWTGLAGPETPIAVSVVVDDEESAVRAVANGARCLKIKVGPDGDLDRIRAIANAANDAFHTAATAAIHNAVPSVHTHTPHAATRYPRLTLRLDANQSWPTKTVHARLAALADLPIELIEEPCPRSHELLTATMRGATELALGSPDALTTRPIGMARTTIGEINRATGTWASGNHSAVSLPVPIALDESLIDLEPAALDQALRSPSLAALILKPTLLGGLGACVALAERARAAGVEAIVTHALEGPVGRSACVELAHAIGGTHAHGVAPQHPDSVSIACGAGCASRPARVTVATPTAETVEAVHAALIEGHPLALLHHALPGSELDRRRQLTERAELAGDDAIVLFTSGSTGEARGVVLSRTAIEAAADASTAQLGWRPDDRWLIALSMAHAGGLAAVVRCWLAGKPIALLEGDWDRARAAKLLEDCTLASLVPAQLADLLAEPAWRPPATLRAVLLGGAAASPRVLAQAAARGVPFLTTYGMTESFGQLATAPLARAGDPTAPLVPLPGVEIEAGTRAEPTPIRVRAPMLASRYLDGVPIAPHFTTSDLGFVEHGVLHVVGRADDVIVTGGENVHPAAIEAVLAATPGVRAACAFGVPDERWGQIVGVAIAAEHVDDAAVASWYAALPAHARPRELAVVPELPMLATGKLDRRAASRLPRAPVRYR